MSEDDDDDGDDFFTRQVCELMEKMTCMAICRGWNKALLVDTTAKMFDQVVGNLKQRIKDIDG